MELSPTAVKVAQAYASFYRKHNRYAKQREITKILGFSRETLNKYLMRLRRAGVEIKAATRRRPKPVTDQVFIDYVSDYKTRTGISPTKQELADHFGIHRAAVTRKIESLAEKGKIAYTPSVSRSIQIKSDI